MKRYHGFSIGETESMMPFERDFYIEAIKRDVERSQTETGKEYAFL